MPRSAFQARFRLRFKPRLRLLSNAWHRKRRTVLYRTGGFVRSSIRRSFGKKNYPRVHQGALKNLTVFQVNRAATRVTIGPLPFPRARRRVRPSGWPDGRALLEYGGRARLFASRSGRDRGVRRYRGSSYIADRRPRAIQALRDNLRLVRLK